MVRLTEVAQVLKNLWYRPIYYGGRRPAPSLEEQRAVYLKHLQARADFVRKRDRLDQMSDQELYCYRREALRKLLVEQGILDPAA